MNPATSIALIVLLSTLIRCSKKRKDKSIGAWDFQFDFDIITTMFGVLTTLIALETFFLAVEVVSEFL